MNNGLTAMPTTTTTATVRPCECCGAPDAWHTSGYDMCDACVDDTNAAYAAHGVEFDEKRDAYTPFTVEPAPANDNDPNDDDPLDGLVDWLEARETADAAWAA